MIDRESTHTLGSEMEADTAQPDGQPAPSRALTGSGSDYEPRPGFLDELFDESSTPRPHGHDVISSLDRMGRVALMDLGRRRDRIFTQRGVTFEITSADGRPRDRPFPLDLVPRIIPAAEWEMIERGLTQRIKALNAFLDDIYHRQEILREGLIPWELVLGCAYFERAVHGHRPPGGIWCHVAGCDLVRDGEGNWRVLEDNVRTPSGISYVIENRLAMTRLAPELFAGYRVRPTDGYPALLRQALSEVAPAVGPEPTVVVWSPGPANSAYFEHTYLARQMGVELVEAGDLIVRDEVCFMRTTQGLTRVDAIYRRLDDAFIDPLEFRPDSVLGVPGLTRAIRAGTVVLANAIGTCVADDKAVYRYVPTMIRHYLNEEPILANVETYLLRNPEELEFALGRMDSLVFKPTGESGGKGVFVGPQANERQIAEQRELVLERPDRWIAQEVVNLSTVPTVTPDGSLAPRHVDFRPFAVFGSDVRIVPGGLTRVAMREGSMVVNSSQGGGSKDTWVLEPAPGDETTEFAALHPNAEMPVMPALGTGEWSNQAQQQQQQSAAEPLPDGGES
ncbi:circularly permuted type 2 ATP-grasp protein [soil metagenome]